MAKSPSPVRLQEELMQSATQAGARHHRSAAEQIEYWAALGRQVCRFVDPDSLLDVEAGLARLQVEPVVAEPVAPEAVFSSVELARQSGELPHLVSKAAIRYQASASQPGALERIAADGSRTTGSFSNGIFIPCEPEPG